MTKVPDVQIELEFRNVGFEEIIGWLGARLIEGRK